MTYTVRAGDNLWTIAQMFGASGPDATASAWPRLWQANREAIGPDPDLIYPGMVLTIPDLDTEE